MYSVKNKMTDAVYSKGSTLDDAKAQVKLLQMVEGKGLSEWSDIKAVQKLADKYGVGEVIASTNKGKKYKVQSPSGKWIHFGAYGMEDFTKHKDEDRRKKFLQRNKKWATASKWTPAWLSYHLLW